MNLIEAKKFIQRGADSQSDEFEVIAAEGFLEGYRQGQAERTQAAGPLLEMIGKLRDEADKYFSSLESGEDYTDSRPLHDAVRKSLQVEREYREKALGEK